MRKRSRNIIALLLTFILCFSEIGSLAVQAADGPVVDLGEDRDDDGDGLVSEEGPDNDAVVSDQTDEETESVVQPDEGAENDTPADEGEDTQAVDVTRLMVWEMLINAFHFSCAVEEYPDNYFNDISGSESYIDTIMLATVMGLTDVEAGQDLVPEGAATREFAACMMQQTVGRRATSESYTFSDTDDVSNKDAVQAAIDSGWFSLVDGKFIPQQAVTAAEFSVLKKAAEDAYAERQMDSSLATKYTLKAGVKDLGEKKTRFSMEDSVLTIVDDSSTGLSKGDIFVVLSDGIPDAYKAESVTISEGNTVVKVSYPEYDDVYEDLQVHQTESLDLRLAQLANPDGGAVISYLVGGTEAEGYEDGEEIYDLSEVGNRDVNALVVGLYAQKIPDITPSKKFDIATVWLKITNLYVEREKKTNEDKAVIYGDIEFGVSIDVDFDALGDYVLKDMQEALTLNITDPVTGCAYFSIGPDMYIKGKLSLIKTGKFNCGIIHRMFGGDDVWLDYTNKDLDAVMDLTARFGIKVAVGVKLWIIPFAELYAEIGASIECKITRHRSNGMVCTDLQAWVYATKGFKLFGQDIEGPEDVLDYYTSPCRISRHYENGVEVDRCNYDAEDAEKEGTNPNVRKGRYYTPGNSRFGSGGLSKRTGSNGEVYNLFEYTLDKKTEEATITSYNGNATSLIIPSSLDGHKVVAIGSSVFKGKTQFVSVIIPSSITSIGNNAFQNCSNLKSVSLSSGLETLGYGVFENCKSLTEITIPKSLTSSSSGVNHKDGTFAGTSLKTVYFEEGVTEITEWLFAGCTSLEEIEIPDTVTVIESGAFYKAEGLKRVKLYSNLKSIEGNSSYTYNGAFYGCKSLAGIELPDSLEKIGGGAFAYCLSLENVKIPNQVTQIDGYAFD
ncbi:MAG: leucine-rich repeat domain-containing protein, partial [Lachnospiraceae bacterium]|nr:leucine-rich repeat domain-containing protein [Lachnospiraceae bacterium]